MKEIIKVMLAEGIDEETIHEVLDLIEENYEIVDEGIVKNVVNGVKNHFEMKKRRKEATIKAISSPMGATINDNKNFAKAVKKKLNGYRRDLRTAQGEKRANIIKKGTALNRMAKQKIVDTLKMEGKIKDFALSKGASEKDANAFVRAFTRKSNRNVIKG